MSAEHIDTDTSPSSNTRLDRVGIFASAACAVHCMAAPLLFLAVPAFASVWSHPASHILMALVVIPLAATVLLRGYRVHAKRWVGGAAIVGIALILVGSALPFLPAEADAGIIETAATETSCSSCCPTLTVDEEGTRSLKVPLATIVTVMGSFCLVVAHAGNLRGCRRCSATDAKDTLWREPKAVSAAKD